GGALGARKQYVARPDAERNPAALGAIGGARQGWRQRDLKGAGRELQSIADVFEVARDEVDWRGAPKACHPHRRRAEPHLLWCSYLLDAAAVDNGDAIGDGQRLHAVRRGPDRRNSARLQKASKGAAQLVA